MKIALDSMGGTLDPRYFFYVIQEILASYPSIDSFVILGNENSLCAIQEESRGALPKSVYLYVANDVISMEDSPLYAIRRKKSSSIVEGIRLLKAHEVDCFVSVGNTGALIAASSLLLPRFTGVDRVGLLASLPTLHGDVAVIDVGAQVNCTSEHLLQFAKLGVAFQKLKKKTYAEDGWKPRVGLLNIGVESKKGRSRDRQTYELLQTSDIGGEFVGNVESGHVFTGDIDVLVTDGFTGNIFLKTVEGLSSFVFQTLQKLGHKVDGMERFNYEEYPGAIVCGVDSTIVKCHGFSSQQAIVNGIKGAISLVEQDVTQTIGSFFQDR